MVNEIIAVALGGAAGSVARYGLSEWVNERLFLRWGAYPYGTLCVNVLGCFCIGVLAHLGTERGLLSPQARLLLITGLLGGLTTFSTFGNETFELLRGGLPVKAMLSVGLNVCGGLLSVWLGNLLARGVYPVGD